MSDPSPLHVTVTLFAALREAAGAEEVAVTLPMGSTVADVWPRLADRFPALRPLGKALAWAVNHTYVKPDHPLADGDQIAVLPPISGGAARPMPRTAPRR